MNDLIIKWEKTAEFNSHEHFIRYPLYICELTYQEFIIKSTIALDLLHEEFCIAIYIDNLYSEHNYCMNSYFFNKMDYDIIDILIPAYRLICHLIKMCRESNIKS